MARRSRALAAAAALALGALAACGADPGSGGESSTGLDAGDVRPLPPNDPTTLGRIYDPLLEPMGLRVTRGALVDRADGGYEVSDQGRHLALYVEPTGDRTDEQYLAGVWDVAALVTPDVFARFTDLDSYDICQEPPPTEDDRPEPPPVSQLDITREAAAEIDWAGGSLVDLVAGSQQGALVLRVDETMAAMPAWVEANQAAAAQS